MAHERSWWKQPGPAPRSPAPCQGAGAAGPQQAGVSHRSRSLSTRPFSLPIPLQRKVSRPHILFQGWMSYPLCLGGVPLPETPLPLRSENGRGGSHPYWTPLTSALLPRPPAHCHCTKVGPSSRKGPVESRLCHLSVRLSP